jgi:hypothetical protein
MVKLPTQAKRVIAEVHAARARADRVIDRTAMRPARTVFNIETGNLGRGLRAAEKGRLMMEADHSTIRRLQGHISVQVHALTQRLGETLASSTRGALEESLRGLTGFVNRVHGDAGPLEDDTVLRSIASNRRVVIEAARKEAMARLAREIETKIRRRLHDIANTEGARVRDMVTAINDELENQWWQVERIVRTESAVAYNTAQVDGIKELARGTKGMKMRWTELINDATGMPFDDRVAVDSFAMHGQVAPVGGSFTMPASLPSNAPMGRGKKASRGFQSMVGQSWSQPPNRPNDRAVLTPWMKEWGIPAWVYQNGRRVNLRPAR